MFRRVDEYTARDEEGVEVRLTPESITYGSGDRWARFEFEYLILEDALLIFPSAIRSWEACHGGAMITPSERDRILKDVEAALGVLGIRYRFDP